MDRGPCGGVALFFLRAMVSEFLLLSPTPNAIEPAADIRSTSSDNVSSTQEKDRKEGYFFFLRERSLFLYSAPPGS
jgi:hypothetical protein